MAEALKHFFSKALVAKLSRSLADVCAGFDERAFQKRATRGLDDLELLARGRHLMEAMHAHLPGRYEEQLSLILRSLGAANTTDENQGGGMTPFFYLPHVSFVATYGVDDFDRSMAAQVELTKRFTCEWSVRPFLERYPERSFEMLKSWTAHEDPHVRRLVSEGTRIRLPWASRIPDWERDLDKIVQLLERLKDDSSSMVRRSVANNLNDIAKVDPARVVVIVKRWLGGASAERRALVEHALRTLVKRGDKSALALLGFGGSPIVAIERVRFEPKRVLIGESVRVSFDVVSRSKLRQSLLVDLVVHFAKANGNSRKVFKLKRVELALGETASFSKLVSLAVYTTRKPYAGRHEVELLLNGYPAALGDFTVVTASSSRRPS